jgi:hypothetical protein
MGAVFLSRENRGIPNGNKKTIRSPGGERLYSSFMVGE